MSFDQIGFFFGRQVYNYNIFKINDDQNTFFEAKITKEINMPSSQDILYTAADFSIPFCYKTFPVEGEEFHYFFCYWYCSQALSKILSKDIKTILYSQ